jgi:enamine deaminase RidA (YjgF/YER057c/UK114 family)
MIKRNGPGPTSCRSVEHGDVIYLSGMTAEDKTADMAGQTRQVLGRIDKALAEAGTDKTRLLSVMIFLSDMAQKEAMNDVWKGWIDPQNTPARVTVGVDLATPTTLVEIMVTAAKKG